MDGHRTWRGGEPRILALQSFVDLISSKTDHFCTVLISVTIAENNTVSLLDSFGWYTCLDPFMVSELVRLLSTTSE